MNNSKLPTEVELIYEVMPCQAMRTSQEPINDKHPCTYFKKWGNYHSYDYKTDGPPPQTGIQHPSEYVGLAPLNPEVLSGCRKSPIMAIGINPNLPGFFKSKKNSVYPLFDDFKQYAHYFRYRSTDKLEIPDDEFEEFDEADLEPPPTLKQDLKVPSEGGVKNIPLQPQPVTFYGQLQRILDDLSERMDWHDGQLKVGEDLAYMNMVACPSAVWMTRPRNNYPRDLVMQKKETKGIVSECFHKKKYFLRQFFQSLPKVIIVISNTTAKAFISEMKNRFIQGDPKIDEGINSLVLRKHVLKYGTLPDGTELTARVIFSHHITGNSSGFSQTRESVMNSLVEEAEEGNLIFNENSEHLLRPKGGCVFCPMMEIGECDYANELEPLSDHPTLTADSSTTSLAEEKLAQLALLQDQESTENDEAWQDDKDDDQNNTINKPSFILNGRVVSMDSLDNIEDDALVLIKEGVIEGVFKTFNELTEEDKTLPLVKTGGTIYPGLIDLHNHFVYNILPLWIIPKKYSNRSQWPRHPEYKSDVSMPIKNVLSKYSESSKAIVRYVETKAILGGTTTGQGMRTQVRGGEKIFIGAMRNVEEPLNDKLLPAGTKVADLYTGQEERIAAFRRAINRDYQGAYFYHLSEGIDERSRQHFTNLKEYNLINSKLVGIHSLGLKEEDLQYFKEKGGKIVWSPFSNQLLYGETIDLRSLKNSGIKFSIGCDWAPSGSKNLLQELKVARLANQEQGSPFSDYELVRAVTSGAAEVTSWQDSLGQVKKGYLADLLVVNTDNPDPYAGLIEAVEKDIELVVIGGHPRYGSKQTMENLVEETNELEPITISGSAKLLHLHSPDSQINDVTFNDASVTLKEAMNDLYAYQEKMESQPALMNDSDFFTLKLDDKFELFEDLLNEDEVPNDAVLLADPPIMSSSIELDSPIVQGDTYRDRINAQSTISQELKELIINSYNFE